MDSFGEPSQATQKADDPRRYGEQNSGFSDEDIADIICLLLPYSEKARQELRRIASESSQHMVSRDDADRLDLDYQLEDAAPNFGPVRQDVGDQHIALRFSAHIKDPNVGFTFGRNRQRCDIGLMMDDPHRRLSNIHFRIFLNEWGVLMLEDQSTNGTVVDNILLKWKGNPAGETRRTLSSGSKIKILLHDPSLDIVFLVRIPMREGKYQEAYQRNVEAYLNRCQPVDVDANETIVPGPGGHVDIFKPVPQRRPAPMNQLRNNLVVARGPPRQQQEERPNQGRGLMDGLPRSWNGSDKYNRVAEIGRGAFATVYRVTSKFNGAPYAAKELDKLKFMKNGVLDQKVENEMKIMQRVNHPHIVRYIEHIDWDDRLLIIIMELVGGGDLGKHILDYGPLPEPDAKSVAKQLLGALGYLHEMNITHRDVKPDNILVSSRVPLEVKLTDFGLSKMIDNDQTFLRTFCGTLLYCAPEVYSEYPEYDDQGRRHPRNRRLRQTTGQRYDHAVDIWSLGGVLFYAMSKRPPFPAKSGASYSELLHQIMTRPLDVSPLLQAGISDEGIDFLAAMLHRRPELRATVEDLENHPWIGGSGSARLSQLLDEAADESLRLEASQLSLQDDVLGNYDDIIPASPDEIIDDEEINDENRFDGYESEKENYTFGRGNPGPRLFGEVNASAMASSGAIAPDRLNLPARADVSSASTEVVSNASDSFEVKDSVGSDDHSTPRQRSQISQKSQPQGLRISVLDVHQSRSIDQLNNMTFDVASQSLGGAESILENLNVESGNGSVLSLGSDLNTSKRKTSSDASDEFEAGPAPERRTLKRLRSEGSVKSPIDNPIEECEYELFAQIPCIQRTQSGRQIDTPVHKSTFWLAQDRKTWHMNYPEMTQLQLDAFKAAATARDEEFGPGKTPLWDLAMKYFPSTWVDDARARLEDTADNTIPSTAIEAQTNAGDDIPDTQPPDSWPAIPTHFEPGGPVVASLTSAPGSAVPKISILITESMASWGRALENTRSYSPKSEGRVPKYALKILLWKPDYDPAKNFRPWNRRQERDEASYHFYVSTKATSGIRINGFHLRSHESKNPAGPARYWATVYDGDRITVWQTEDRSSVTELIFRCHWGGSSQPRPAKGPLSQPSIAPEAICAKLDELTPKTEKRMRGLGEHDLRMEAADRDADERALHIDRERDRSRVFELKRLEACRALTSRRGSSSTGGGLYGESSAQSSWQSLRPGARAVPSYRTASPGVFDFLRGGRRS